MIFSVSKFKQCKYSQVVCLLSQRHGRQSQLFVTAIKFGFLGRSFFSSVGPKIATVFVPTATPMCIGAESEHIITSIFEINSAKS